MNDDILQRLSLPAECPSCGYAYHDDLCGEAAMVIQALRAEVDIKGYRVDAAVEEIERLRKWKAEATVVIEKWVEIATSVQTDRSLGKTHWGIVADRITELTLDNDRLRHQVAMLESVIIKPVDLKPDQTLRITRGTDGVFETSRMVACEWDCTFVSPEGVACGGRECDGIHFVGDTPWDFTGKPVAWCDIEDDHE